jgi:Protein of unknown function (DUF4242)
LPRYLVERFLPGNPEAQLSAIADAAAASAEKMRREGIYLRYLGSTMIPEDEICFCLFEGPSAEAVGEANRRAGLRFERILVALTADPTRPAD